VVPGFVIQGGYLQTRQEPLDERQQGYVRTLEPEFNATKHERGILSMARGAEAASATTSFFIVLAPAESLDGKYTAFGRVVSGMDVIEKIEGVPREGEAPTTRIEVTRARVVPVN
jgi:peptidyl-prolyl cis-trans isomerase B (cyclophilin B)